MEKFTKKQKISEIREGDKVDDVFFVKFKKGISSYAKGFSFELTLSDNSGRNMDYKYWGSMDEKRVKSLYDLIKPDSIVHIQGKTAIYKERLQLTTNEPFIFEVLSEEQYNQGDFVKAAKKDINLMYNELLNSIGLVGDEELKRLLLSVFKDKDVEQKFKNHPGAIEIHHNWVGGLLEHTLEVLKYCKISWEMYPQLRKDLLIAGALLHDIGKLEEIKVTSRIRGTNKGQLTGHLILGIVFVSNKCDEIGATGETKNKLLHIITSHHGKLEFGSPKEPMFPEALAIYYADELSSKIAEMIEFVEDAKQSTEDDFMFHKRNGKNILLK